MSLHGLLLMDKPAGMTSHDLVAKVRRILDMKSVGHCGTLDPMATGLMVLLLGEATKVSSYLLERDKAYRVRAQLGVSYDTLDTSGTLLATMPVSVSSEQVFKAVHDLEGEFDLSVPIFSAVKVGGEKMYEKARRQEQFETPIKRMKFYDIKVVDSGPEWIEADLRCSKGSYIRSWVEILGKNLGVGAAMSALRRTSSEPFGIDQAVSLEELTKAPEKGFVPLPMTLPHWKVARASGHDLTLIRNGQISHDLKSVLITLFRPGVDEGVKILSKTDGQLVALVGLEPEQGFVIRRVFRY